MIACVLLPIRLVAVLGSTDPVVDDGIYRGRQPLSSMTIGIAKNQRPVVGDTMSRKDDADEQEQAVAESRGGDSLNRRAVLKRTGQVGANRPLPGRNGNE